MSKKAGTPEADNLRKKKITASATAEAVFEFADKEGMTTEDLYLALPLIISAVMSDIEGADLATIRDILERLNDAVLFLLEDERQENEGCKQQVN